MFFKKSNFLYKIIRLYIPLLVIISTFFFISSCTGTYVIPEYVNEEYKDFKLFMPYFEFNHILKDKSNDLKVAVGALTTDGVRLHSSEFVEFNYNK